MNIISVKNLKKYYRVYQKEPGLWGSIKSLFVRQHYDVKAVNGVSFGIQEGELVGFIGPNGAGKTTTLKVLSGLLFPTSGQVQVLGFEPFKRQSEFQKKFSLVMGQKNQLWWDLPAWESFILNKEIYEIPQKQFEESVAKLTKMLEIEDLLKVQVRKLSLGQRMKCELVASLLHSPKVLFLDEPTIGLDIVAQKTMRDFIKEYNEQGKATIILTSHYMADVKELCKRVIVIDQGKILYDGLLEEIVNKFAPFKVIKVKEYSGNYMEIQVGKNEVAEKTRELLSKFKVADLTIEDPPIEDIIRQIFQKGV
ncbi:ABC transporter ATP-binding protein [Candidatus Daviesbacteria bacterium]|nr:ABC transporter ATP-binding protein [Candidatus Daviesbacteria bacterium]